jgi:hypothetical protein
MTRFSAVGPALHLTRGKGAVMNGTEVDGRGDRTSSLGLRIPADIGAPVRLVALSLTAVELSEAIGGGLLEEALDGEYNGDGYTFYLDEHRVAKGMPGNERAAVLATRLGHVNRELMADLRGDALVMGLDRRLDDSSIPRGVLEAASRAGLLVERPGVER